MTKFIYDFDGVKWVLENYNDLRTGTDPEPQNVEVSYNNNKRHHAPYEGWCMVAGEIAARVKLCGEDGMITSERYGMISGHKKTEGDIEHEWHIPLYDVCRKIKRVMIFCTGKERKSLPYWEWLRKRRP